MLVHKEDTTILVTMGVFISVHGAHATVKTENWYYIDRVLDSAKPMPCITYDTHFECALP